MGLFLLLPQPEHQLPAGLFAEPLLRARQSIIEMFADDTTLFHLLPEDVGRGGREDKYPCLCGRNERIKVTYCD